MTRCPHCEEMAESLRRCPTCLDLGCSNEDCLFPDENEDECLACAGGSPCDVDD